MFVYSPIVVKSVSLCTSWAHMIVLLALWVSLSLGLKASPPPCICSTCCKERQLTVPSVVWMFMYVYIRMTSPGRDGSSL